MGPNHNATQNRCRFPSPRAPLSHHLSPQRPVSLLSLHKRTRHMPLHHDWAVLRGIHDHATQQYPQQRCARKEYALFDLLVPYILEPLMGHTWDSYFYHHVKHHHAEGRSR